MAKQLNFETGVVEYDINGAVTVRFNPTDAAFVERLYRTFADLDERQGEFQGRVNEIGEDGDMMFAYASERDAEMRGLIDGLLGPGTADVLFPEMNCYALAEGLPVWVNLMLAIAEEVEAAFSSAQKKSDPRIRGYSEKYGKMMAKYKKGKK